MSYKRLSLEEREAIARGVSAGKSLKDTALELNRAVSTVSRELARHHPSRQADEPYSPSTAHRNASETARRAHRRPIAIDEHPELRNFIIEKLKIRWSPKQISRKIKETMPPELHVSHETIYQYIFIQSKGAMRKALIDCLRQQRPKRRKRGGPPDKRGQIPGIVTIHERPPEVAERAVPGHWEGDLIVGKDHQGAVITLVERASRFLLMTPIPDLRAATFDAALRKLVRRLPKEMAKSITYDRGKEMSNHQSFTIDTKIAVYFCDPHSPWQRGTNENTNGLIRDFFPKGTDFRQVSYQKLARVQSLLNDRPRETLGFETPRNTFSSFIKKPS
jgi:IS30 family transposase